MNCKVSIEFDDCGGWCKDELTSAIFQANQFAGLYTVSALVVGILSQAILSEKLAPDEEALALKLIDSIGVPCVVRKQAELAKQDYEDRHGQ